MFFLAEYCIEPRATKEKEYVAEKMFCIMKGYARQVCCWNVPINGNYLQRVIIIDLLSKR
jgi:hypothetical protein